MAIDLLDESYGLSFPRRATVSEAQLMEFLENRFGGHPTEPICADRDTLIECPV